MINILIVDDDITMVEEIRDCVHWTKLNIDEIYIAYNVVSARKILQANSIDIVVSDIEMPQETGLDLLKWIREQKVDCEFLLLTCHESFSYAANAMNYDAAAYLTKPFDIHIMELTLQKIVTKLSLRRGLQKSSEYGTWMEKNQRIMKLGFWKSVFEGEIVDAERIKSEIASRHLDINSSQKYCLVYSKLSNIEADNERYGKSVFEFVLEGFYSEILTGKVENENVIKFRTGSILNFITVCEEDTTNLLQEKCWKLIDTCKVYFKGTVTCCISDEYEIYEFAKARQHIEKLFDYNVGNFGKVFREQEVEILAVDQAQILDLNKLLTLVEQKDKTEILRYLKKIFDELTAYKKLNAHALYLMKEEITQVTYADLMKQGIQATKLFYDDLSIQMTEHAVDSTVDMIRWVNYILGKTFAYEEEITKTATIVDKINDYIHKHYMEAIGRNEVAGEFFLTPEYLAKMYKKKTGINLKDYINEYRIEKAKEYLKTGEKNVSRIAEMVGFDNYSYFSTLFKKITGVSPKDYRNI